MSASALSDFKPSEFVASLLFGCAVLVGAGVAMSLARLDRKAAAPAIDRGTALPVRIVPMLDPDAPLLKLGGKRNNAKLPDRWLRQAPRPRVEQRAFASTKASKSAQDIPQKDVKMAASATKPPPPDAEIAKQVDTPLNTVVDAGAPANIDTPGHADGVKEGTETDPLKARAVDLYRAKIAAWFSSRFAVHGSGLPKAEIEKYRVSASVTIGSDSTVGGYTMTPSGQAFDSAARTALEGAKGQSLPPPPENYPDLAQHQMTSPSSAERTDATDTHGGFAPETPRSRLHRILPPFAALAALSCLLARAAADTPPPAAATPQDPNDLLGNIVVVAGAGRPLPKIAVLPSLASENEDVTLRSVVRRDLDLCGEFDLLPDSAAPEGLYLADTPVDVKAWTGKGVEALVKVNGKPQDKDHAELRGQVYLMSHGATAVFDKRYSVPEDKLREESHRLADLLIGALTGQNGGFASHMTFVAGGGGVRRVFTIDADGHDAKAISPTDRSTIAPAFGKDGALFYAGAPQDGGLYKVYTATGSLVPIPYKGSIYGIAFSRDHAQVAVSLGAEDGPRVFLGSDFSTLQPASEVKMALHPTFTPSGKLAFSGEGRVGQRIFVDGKPVTPQGIFASSPVFCNNPDGVRLVFSVGVGRDSDLVATGEHGGGLARLTQGQGQNSYPACSPDGRMLAFFSTRKSGEGPGLYLMRIDGQRAKLISPLIGDSLRWDGLPTSAATEIKAPAAAP